jgi:hypothetical protein
MDHEPHSNQGIKIEDIDRFLAGELPEDSLESERIVRDMVDHADGQVWTYLRSLSEQRAARLDALFRRPVDGSPTERDLRSDPQLRQRMKSLWSMSGDKRDQDDVA